MDVDCRFVCSCCLIVLVACGSFASFLVLFIDFGLMVCLLAGFDCYGCCLIVILFMVFAGLDLVLGCCFCVFGCLVVD